MKRRPLTELVFDEDKVTLRRKKSERKVNARPIGTPILIGTRDGYNLEEQTVREETDKRINAYVANYSHSDTYHGWDSIFHESTSRTHVYFNVQYFQILHRK